MARTNGGQPLWNQHPKVFLEFTAKGEAHCPYCGTVYLWEGATPIPHDH